MSLPETNYLLHAFKPERVEVAGGVLSKQRLVVSDCINVKGAVTGIGVPDWCVSHEEAKNDALVVSTLLQSGCRLVGKAQVDDFGTSISGQNPFLAKLTNSMSPGTRVGGSSSGAALAIVNSKASIAVGNAVCGGILIPAAYCGLFGYRPSLGMVDLRGMASLSPSFDAVGFMARSLPTLQQIAEKCWTKPARPVRLNAVKYASSLFQELLDNDALLEWETKLSSLNFMRNDVPNLSKLTLTQAHNIHTAILGREIDIQYGQWLDAHNPRFSDETGTFLKTIRDKGFKEYVESKKKREFFSDSLQGFFPVERC